MHVETTGSGSPLLLIHPTGGSSEWWAGVRQHLAGDHRVTAFDRRGYGRTGGKPVRDVRVHAADAAALIDEPAIVAGWSSGGLTALQLALDHPEKVAGLVVLEPPVHALRCATPGLLRAITRAKALQLRGQAVAGAEWFQRWASTYAHGGNAYDGLPPARQEDVRSAARSVLADLDVSPHGAGGDHIPLERFPALRVPATLVLGDASDVWFHRMALRLGVAWPALRMFVVPGASHYLGFDDPVRVAAAIRDVSARA